MKKLIIICLVLPLGLFAQEMTEVGEGVVKNPRFRGIGDSIQSKIKKGEIPSFSVAVSEKGRIIWQQSFGWADKEKGIPATPSTAYALASLSKSITATAVMLLVEKGIVRLDEPVEKYLGQSKLTVFQGTPSDITLNHLLNMTAGIPHQWKYVYPDELKDALMIDEQIRRYGIVVFSPGEVFSYSNFSPSVAEAVISHISRKSLSAFMKEKLFNPLGMKHAAVERAELPAESIAKAYSEDGERLGESEFFPKGGAGYYGSVSDLVRYGMFHLKEAQTNQLISKSNIDILHRPVPFTDRSKYYAFGWGVLHIGQGMGSLLSNGAIEGAASSLLLVPEKNIAVACLANATVGNEFTDQVAFTITNNLIPGYLESLGKFFQSVGPLFEEKPFTIADSLAGEWEGEIISYQDSIPVTMQFNNEGHVFIQIEGQFKTVLNNITTSNGIINGECLGYIPLPETRGSSQFLQLALKPGRNHLFGSISTQSYMTERPRFLFPSYIHLQKKQRQSEIR